MFAALKVARGTIRSLRIYYGDRGRRAAMQRLYGLIVKPGDLSPSLKGTGSRWSEGELRLRLVDASRLNPDTIMPSFYRIDGLNRVAQNFRGKPVLTAEQIEDVVAYLTTLKD